jgi:Complex 1 protein (LYR family)
MCLTLLISTSLNPLWVPRRLLLSSLSIASVEPVERIQWFATDSSASTVPKDDDAEAQGAVATTKRSRRRFRRIEDVPSYQEFMHRQSVLSLFRKFLRTVHGLSDRREVQKQIKKEFGAMKNETDPWNRKRAINEGKRRLKDLQTTVSTSVTFGSSSNINSSHAPPNNNNQDDDKVGSGWPWERN